MSQAGRASTDIRIISLGTLAAHPLWMEKAPVRTGHATTTLIRSGRKIILVDPGLPEPVIAARLNERSGLLPSDVTHVFLTSFTSDTSRGIGAFSKATWWIHEREREAVGVPLAQQLKVAVQGDDVELKALLQAQVAILKRCEAAPDRLADGVDLFPLPGVTPGMCGLIVGMPVGMGFGFGGGSSAVSREMGSQERRSVGGGGTLVITGDAIATVEHLHRGLVLTPAADVKTAQESFREAVEIADCFVLGRDNLVGNPVRRGF